MRAVLTRWRSAGMHAYLEYVRRNSTIQRRGDFNSGHILVLWHENIYLALLACHSVEDVAVYVWKHPMAEFSKRLIRSFGMQVIEGSEDNLYGRRSVIQWLCGSPERKLVMAVDGPLGPPGVIKDGALVFATLARVPVRVARFEATGLHRLPTWDNRCVPEPGVKLILSNEVEILPQSPAAKGNLQQALHMAPIGSSPQRTVSSLCGRCWVRACSGPYYFGRITHGYPLPGRQTE